MAISLQFWQRQEYYYSEIAILVDIFMLWFYRLNVESTPNRTVQSVSIYNAVCIQYGHIIMWEENDSGHIE